MVVAKAIFPLIEITLTCRKGFNFFRSTADHTLSVMMALASRRPCMMLLKFCISRWHFCHQILSLWQMLQTFCIPGAFLHGFCE